MNSSANDNVSPNIAAMIAFQNGIAAARTHIEDVIKELGASPADPDGIVRHLRGEAFAIWRIFASLPNIAALDASVGGLAAAHRQALLNRDLRRKAELGREIVSTCHVIAKCNAQAASAAHQIFTYHEAATLRANEYGSRFAPSQE